MAVRDIEAFLRQAAANFDPNLDTNPGSPFDTKIIQTLVRRIGTDPFSVDLSTFLSTRLQQAYPKLATDEGDNLTDLLIKPITLLWDPVVRENTRVRRGLSFNDPSTLTLEEADSLGGNFFIPRRRGRFSRGRARIIFGKPQDVSVNQNNFITSRGGLVFFPSSLQSIRANEMLINVTQDNLYYFDINVVAELPGTQYNIEANELNSIANLNAAVRVTNTQRFRDGEDEEDAVTYVGRLEQSLGEKSMVTLRGIAAKVLEAFPEVQRLNVVGFNDPEMQRDVIVGGGLGPVVASGVAGAATDDTEGQATTRRFSTTEVDFDVLVGAAGGFVLTVINGTAGTEPAVDVPVRGVYDANAIDLDESVLVLGRTGLTWILRRSELTLSHIPGGILFPNTSSGELRVDSDAIHVGGAYDIHTRPSDVEEATLTITNVTDDEPALSGLEAFESTLISAEGFTLLDYGASPPDDIISVVEQAALEGWTLQIQEGPNAGNYRVIDRQTTPGNQVFVRTDPEPPNVDPEYRRWRLFDQVNIDLVEPKETRIEGEDLVAVQGSDIVTTAGGVNFDQFGVAEGDTLRVLTGKNKGDYTVISDPLVPGFNQLQVDRDMPFSAANVDYLVFRPGDGGIELPLVRVTSLELLDSSSQPQGSFIPYAKPVDVQSRAFQNPARGVKHDFRDARLGLVSASADQLTKEFTITGGSNSFNLYLGSTATSYLITVTPGTYTVDALVTELNTQIEAATLIPDVAVRVNELHFGIRPVGNGYVAATNGSAMNVLFGDSTLKTTADIQTDEVTGTWASLSPAIDFVTGLDTAQVVDGRNVGFYGGPFVTNAVQVASSSALMPGTSFTDIQQGRGLKYFAPDVGRRVIIGSRSLGSVRVYFLDPTSFEVDENTIFELDQGDAGVLRFIPDPTLSHQQIPPLPDGATPVDGESADGGTTLTSASQDFGLSGVNEGDELEIENHPLLGSIALSDPVLNLAGKTFVYSLEEGADRTVVFVQDDPSILSGAVTLNGVVEQINASAGVNIVSLDSNRLKFSTDLKLVIRASSTATTSSDSNNWELLSNVANYTPTLRFNDADISNESPHAGTYSIIGVEGDTLTISGTFPNDANWLSPVVEQTFKVRRRGVQRISTTQMAEQQAEASLYYADIELVSQGAGDAWNINSGEQLIVSGYKSDGYYLTTDDENLTFSPAERPRLVISRSILEEGVDDDPRNATQVTGQNIEITYDRSTTVQNVQDFALSEVERVVCASPLSRHLVPHYIRYDYEYFGGSDEDVVLADHQKYIRELFPVDTLDASDLQKMGSDRGATKITNPLTLIAIVHNTDRSVWIQRSQNSLGTTRLAAFIPDILNVVRNVTGGVA
jgi:hypothetical protein